MRTIGPVEIVESAGPRDTARSAVEASDAGARALVVLGGDAAANHALRGLIRTRATTPMAMLAVGRGNDFARSLAAPVHDYLAMARLIAAGETRTVDAAHIDGVPFANAASFGFDADVVGRTQRPGVARSTAAYASSAMDRLWRYQGFDATVDSASGSVSGRWLALVFANGSCVDGAFCVAPHAQLDDALLDCVAIADGSPLRRAALLARAFRGSHVGVAGVSSLRDAEFTLTFAERPQFQADGELYCARSHIVRVGVLPRAFRVFAPRP